MAENFGFEAFTPMSYHRRRDFFRNWAKKSPLTFLLRLNGCKGIGSKNRNNFLSPNLLYFSCHDKNLMLASWLVPIGGRRKKQPDFVRMKFILLFVINLFPLAFPTCEWYISAGGNVTAEMSHQWLGWDTWKSIPYQSQKKVTPNYFLLPFWQKNKNFVYDLSTFS